MTGDELTEVVAADRFDRWDEIYRIAQKIAQNPNGYTEDSVRLAVAYLELADDRT